MSKKPQDDYQTRRSELIGNHLVERDGRLGVHYDSKILYGAQPKKFNDVFDKDPKTGKFKVKDGIDIVGKVKLGCNHIFSTWKSTKGRDGRPYGYNADGTPIVVEHNKVIASVDDLGSLAKEGMSMMFANKKKQVNVKEDSAKMAELFIAVPVGDPLYDAIEIVKKENRRRYENRLNDKDSKDHFGNHYDTDRLAGKK